MFSISKPASVPRPSRSPPPLLLVPSTASTNHTCHEQSWRRSKTLRKNEARNHENHEKPVVKPDGIPMVSGCFWSVNASFNRQKSKRATVVCPSRIDMPGRTFSAGGIEASGLKKVGIDSLICRCILSVQHAACIATTFPKHPQSPSQIVSWDRPQISLSCQARIGNK